MTTNPFAWAFPIDGPARSACDATLLFLLRHLADRGSNALASCDSAGPGRWMQTKRDKHHRRRRGGTLTTAEDSDLWSAPPARPDRPGASMDCRCPHVWVRTEFSHQLEVEQATKTYECRECSIRLVQIADGLPGIRAGAVLDCAGQLPPLSVDACITADRPRWRKISDGVRAANWRGDAHERW